MSASVPEGGQRRVHVVQGEYEVSNDPDVVLTTILGSCVAVCLRDSERRIGGMNHFLLPDGESDGLDDGKRYGVHAMELLINGLLRKGARRETLEAKIFGGARMFDGLLDVGAANAAFAERFLKDEGIRVVGGSLGGSGARRVKFWPTSGRAQQRVVTDTATIGDLKRTPTPAPVADAGELELF
jgi:chemotaxis protein CheD